MQNVEQICSFVQHRFVHLSDKSVQHLSKFTDFLKESKEFNTFCVFVRQINVEQIHVEQIGFRSTLVRRFDETIVELYNPCYKHVNKKYPPNFKANIFLQNGSFEGIISV